MLAKEVLDLFKFLED